MFDMLSKEANKVVSDLLKENPKFSGTIRLMGKDIPEGYSFILDILNGEVNLIRYFEGITLLKEQGFINGIEYRKEFYNQGTIKREQYFYEGEEVPKSILDMLIERDNEIKRLQNETLIEVLNSKEKQEGIDKILETSKKVYDKFTEDIRILQRENFDLKENINHLKGVVKTSRDNNIKHIDRLILHGKEISELEEKNKNLRRSNKNIRISQEKLLEVNQNLNNKIYDYRKENSLLERNVNELYSENRKLNSEIARLSMLVLKGNKKIKDLENSQNAQTIAELSREVGMLRHQLRTRPKPNCNTDDNIKKTILPNGNIMFSQDGEENPFDFINNIINESEKKCCKDKQNKPTTNSKPKKDIKQKGEPLEQDPKLRVKLIILD